MESESSFEDWARTFSPISPDALRLILASTCRQRLSRGETLLAEGAVCRHIYFVEKGYLRAFHNRDGVEINLSFSFEGTFVTDLGSIRSGAPSSVTIRAEEESIVVAIARADLMGLYAGSAEIEAFGRQLLEELLAGQEEQANLFRLHTPAERYHRVVSRNPELLQRVSLSHLASWLGVTRETLSRIRSRG